MCQLTLFGNAAGTSTGSPAGSVAKTCPSPAKGAGSARKPNRASRGGICSGSSGDSDRLGSSLRTFLASGLSRLTGCSLRWKDSATPAGRSWWVLSTPERRIGAIASGLSGTAPTHFATPTASISKGGAPQNSKGKRDLRLDVLRPHWPTPQANDSEKRGEPSLIPGQQKCLPVAVRHWQTPSASTATAGCKSRSGNRKGELLLIGQVIQQETNDVRESNLSTRGTDRVHQLSSTGTHHGDQTQRERLSGQRLAPRDHRRTATSQETNPPAQTIKSITVSASSPAAAGDAPTTWPTPAARDWKSSESRQHDKNSRPLNQVAALLDGRQDRESRNTLGKPRGSLSSIWVSMLQGLPDGWTDTF
jgi:hypothetical protein